jgi:indole-3-glycerol phosphate synthase
MPTILDEIVAYTREFVAESKRRISFEALKEQAAASSDERCFMRALQEADGIALIAEVKKASPSKGLIRPDFDPVEIAATYEANGARAVSVLTDERYFKGSACALTQVRQAVDLPILRKDFTVDPYQVYEARAIGADAVLLIVSILSADQLKDYIGLAHSLNLDALVEVHTEDELETALSAEAQIVGINNRDLRTFQTDLSVTEHLIGQMPEDVIAVSESGIHTREDVLRLQKAGADAILVGESLMREPDIGKKLRELLGRNT